MSLLHERPESFDDVLDAILLTVYRLPEACRPEWLARRRAWESSQQNGYGWTRDEEQYLTNLLVGFALRDRAARSTETGE